MYFNSQLRKQMGPYIGKNTPPPKKKLNVGNSVSQLVIPFEE